MSSLLYGEGGTTSSPGSAPHLPPQTYFLTRRTPATAVMSSTATTARMMGVELVDAACRERRKRPELGGTNVPSPNTTSTPVYPGG